MTEEGSWDLSALSRAVAVARSDLGRARSANGALGSASVATEQRQLLTALERYAAALDHHGSPLPYRMRDEVAMYRTMFDPRRRL